MTTVNWVQDENGNYEVSSAEHLIQIMNRGTIYTDTGASTPGMSAARNLPTDYWYLNYIQTVDIDLADHHADIYPIGIQNFSFQGIYDGQEFRISNYSYTDPAATSDTCNNSNGLFGIIEISGSIRNIRMDGVCIVDGFKDRGGILVGNYNQGGALYNLECNCSPGSFVRGKGNIGGVFGWLQGSAGSVAYGITLKGTIDLISPDTTRGDTEAAPRVGGVIGTTVDAGYSNIRNLATFPTPIVASLHAGGVVGNNIRHQSFSNIMNYMKGDISCPYAGGVFGNCGSLSGGTVQNVVNSMTGNINGTNGAGGIIGITASTSVTVSDVSNYMTGNITATRAGGIIGHMSSVIAVTNSVNAMNGSVENSVSGNTTSSTSSVYVDTSFGLVAIGNDHASVTPPTGWLTDTTFTDLPYFDVSITDSYGTIYNWDFVFGNLSGKAAYSNYTHLSLHLQNVSAPLYTTMDLDNTNTTTYLAFANLGTETLFMNDTITHYESEAVTVYDFTGLVVQISSKSSLTLTPAAIYINFDIESIPGAVGYQFTTKKTSGGSSSISYSGDVKTSVSLKQLSPLTEYEIDFFVDYGSGFTLLETKTTSTLANSIENYDPQHFLSEGGTDYDLSELDASSISNISSVLNDLFTTGDNIELNINGTPLTKKSTFVKRGSTVAIDGADALVAPFDENAGAGQQIIMTLSDNSTAAVSYDETTNSVTVESNTYSPGDSFILDGKKVVVFDL